MTQSQSICCDQGSNTCVPALCTGPSTGSMFAFDFLMTGAGTVAVKPAVTDDLGICVIPGAGPNAGFGKCLWVQPSGPVTQVSYTDVWVNPAVAPNATVQVCPDGVHCTVLHSNVNGNGSNVYTYTQAPVPLVAGDPVLFPTPAPTPAMPWPEVAVLGLALLLGGAWLVRRKAMPAAVAS